MEERKMAAGTEAERLSMFCFGFWLLVWDPAEARGGDITSERKDAKWLNNVGEEL